MPISINKKSMKKNKLLQKPNNLKDLALGMITYNASSILGPLIIFLILGFTLDKLLNTKPIMLICSVILAFITTNILIIKKTKKLIKEFNNLYPEEKEEESIEAKEIRKQ